MTRAVPHERKPAYLARASSPPALRSRAYSVPALVPSAGLAALIATGRCLATGRIARGPAPARLADAVAARLGRRHALPLSRGRFAIELALRAMQLRLEDEVVIPSYVCRAVHEAVLRSGATPVFADIGSDLHVTPRSVEQVLGARTRCVIVSHLYGNTAPVDEIERLLAGSGIALLDDAAQSFGARRGERPVGSFGACGIVSCGVGKALAGCGGGLLVTDSAELHARAAALALDPETVPTVLRRALAYWVWHRLRRLTAPLKGASDTRFSRNAGAGSEPRSMSNLDAAIALAQLGRLREDACRRRRAVGALRDALGSRSSQLLSDLSPACMALGAVFVLPEAGPSREEALARLDDAGIEAIAGYRPLHREADRTAALPVSGSLAPRTLLLPASSRLARPRHVRALSLALGLTRS